MNATLLVNRITSRRPQDNSIDQRAAYRCAAGEDGRTLPSGIDTAECAVVFKVFFALTLPNAALNKTPAANLVFGAATILVLFIAFARPCCLLERVVCSIHDNVRTAHRLLTS